MEWSSSQDKYRTYHTKSQCMGHPRQSGLVMDTSVARLYGKCFLILAISLTCVSAYFIFGLSVLIECGPSDLQGQRKRRRRYHLEGQGVVCVCVTDRTRPQLTHERLVLWWRWMGQRSADRDIFHSFTLKCLWVISRSFLPQSLQELPPPHPTVP